MLMLFPVVPTENTTELPFIQFAKTGSGHTHDNIYLQGHRLSKSRAVVVCLLVIICVLCVVYVADRRGAEPRRSDSNLHLIPAGMRIILSLSRRQCDRARAGES